MKKITIEEMVKIAREQLQNTLRKFVDPEIEVREEVVLKMNDQKLHGLSIVLGDDPAPTYYLDEAYQMVQEGADMESMIYELASQYRANLKSGPQPAEILPDMSFDTIEERVGLRLVGKDFNKEFLQTVPFEDCGNGYALLCDVQIKASDGGMFSSIVTNDMLKEYGYDMAALFEAAKENEKEFNPPRLFNPSEILGGDPDADACYVLTTERERFGAIALYLPGTLDMITSFLKEDFYCLPSSLHEFMIVRASNVKDPFHLRELVKEANETVVSASEVLSDDPLFYSLETGQLTKVPTFAEQVSEKVDRISEKLDGKIAVSKLLS